MRQTVTPYLLYEDVDAALGWLAQAFGFRETNRIAGPDGKPYQRQVVVFESALQQALGAGKPSPVPTLQVARIDKDPRPPVLNYEPGHPDADANGMVAMPNINVNEEMADMIAASRAFEANLAVVKNSRAMAMQTLSIGKH